MFCIRSDSRMMTVTSHTSLYPSLYPTQMFDDQETSFLYQSSIRLLTGYF